MEALLSVAKDEELARRLAREGGFSGFSGTSSSPSWSPVSTIAVTTIPRTPSSPPNQFSNSDYELARLLQEKEELENKVRHLERNMNNQLVNSGVVTPSYWAPQTVDYQYFDVSPTSQEYKDIEAKFRHGTNRNVVRIERHQNLNQWRWYSLKCLELREKNKNSSGVNEKFAFHGSRADAYDTIMKDGFDHRIAHMGGALGAGIYFAESSATSLSYVPQTNDLRKMLFCRVALGNIGQGKPGLRRPPSMFGNANQLYDSVGNSNVYVLFDNYSCYPEYIIYFN
eukprot:TRINITY_DN2556_c0_g1_i4.p1 TRINITY_DN2556_c0_g1~~TRINITY_DN2556_c0_g1_i4.p1  ORF type:complete len:283 (-),score=36.86 TRINITY_DN2556_c0_g1_i4:215-1063(-)